jgi:hypothetical protein
MVIHETRKTSLEFKYGAYLVTWCDGSESKYYDLKKAVSAIERDFDKYTPENERK